MGQRANLVIVENGQQQLFYSHWCANTLTRDLFWGPEHAVRFIRQQREVDESGWLEEVWAEGAAVVDLDKQILLLFGGEDVLYDVPLRRVYLDLLNRVWKNWDVRWAYEGIAAIADYAGYPRTNVLSTEEEKVECSLTPPENKDWTDLVASIQWTDDQIRLYPLAGNVKDYLSNGPNLLEYAAQPDTGQDRFELEEWSESFPSGGFHIAIASQTIEFWTAMDAPDIVARIAKSWPDWAVHWHKDAFEFQSDRTKGRLRFLFRSRASLQKQLTEMLLAEAGRSGADAIQELVEHDREEGKEVNVNPWALRDDKLELSMDVRIRIIASAIDV